MAKTNSYGIKEVADVKFYPVGTTITVNGSTYVAGTTTASVSAKYTFDSLKVSNIEVTSESTSARGGRGNPELISWSYGKEITLNIEDALFSMATLDLMFGAKEEAAEGSDTKALTITADTFPDMYTIVGQTLARSYSDGKDSSFMFVIPKAKVEVGGTLTMSADGDPSTFAMAIKALNSGEDDTLIKFYKA